MRQKVAIINQRYGLEVNGGSELYTRQIAERLCQKFDVEVLTTCALDYMTWSNYYQPGIEELNGVRVRRFQTDRERVTKKFVQVDAEMLQTVDVTCEQEEKWLEEQGPYCPKLIAYIKEHAEEYDVFIVVTYLYYTAVKSLPIIGDKAIFIPTAHQEPYIDLNFFEKIFEIPKAYVFLTDEEKALVRGKFPSVQEKPFDVMGVGVDVPEKVDADAFKQKYKLDNYIIYVGRIDQGKDCPRMFDYFIEYKKRNPGNLKLVLMGKAVVEIPQHSDIISLGFVSEEDKFNGIKGARALILPSKFESLSISVLEAMTLSIPVIVNGRCDVLKGHCVKSNGGLYYMNYFEFEGCVNYLLSNADVYEQMCENANEYVATYFEWDVIIDKFERIIRTVSGSGEV